MKLKTICTFALLCTVAQSLWAQTTVKSEQELKDAITAGATNIQLTADIPLQDYLNIEGKTVTIDLNGHKLSRNLSDYDRAGHVIWAHGGSNLTLTSGVAGGSIEGGMAYNGGAIHIPNGNTVSATDVIFQNNSAVEHAGAIWNNGTFTATNCTFTNNSAKDVGAIYNSVTEEGAGTATLTSCTFTGNWGTTGAGALANALGATVMTIEDCSIMGNTAESNGGGIWNGGTLNMKGTVTVTDNTRAGSVVSNVYLKNDKVITVTGSLTGSNIGVEMESTSGTFTSGYKTCHNGVNPSAFFTADRSSIVNMELASNGEACLTSTGAVNYIERSWDETNKKVVNIEKSLTGGQYKEVTNAPADSPNEWFWMGESSDDVAEYYVVREDVNRETIVVQGKNVHLILCNGATLTLTGGLKLEGENKLHIHSQSYGGDMGRLMVTNSYKNAAGIGSAQDNGAEKTVGELVIHGGHIEATGGEYGAGIGSCKRSNKSQKELCNNVTVYGGYVKATGGNSGAGIGGGGGFSNNYGVDGGDFVLYDGTVIAQGGDYASGVGGGGGHSPQSFNNIFATGGWGGMVYVYGGMLTATGGERASGIGSGNMRSNTKYNTTHTGGKVFIKGGTVAATGGKYGAGIGGGIRGGGAIVEISGGTVTANGGTDAAGIGGGEDAFGGTVTISGGTVHANGNDNGAGIGGGEDGNGGDVTITGGTVIAKAGNQGDGNRAIGPGCWNLSSHDYGTLVIGDMIMVGAGNNGSVERIFDADERKNACWFRTYAEISSCTHPSGITYTINGKFTHTSHCKHCSLAEKADHFNSDGQGTCICGYKDGEGYCTITVATSRDGAIYEGVGVMANVGNNMPYTLPVCSSIPEGYDFAGWAVNPTSHNGILPNEGEELKQAGENITVTGDVSIFARYKDLVITLADNSDNAEKLYNYNEKKNASVTLDGRTLYKDGGWNTLCLPFEVSTTSEPLSGDGVVAMTLDTENCGFSNGTLTLNFTDVNGATIPAGTPFIIKWPNDANNPTIVDPTFTNVTISKELNDQTCTINDEMSITFKGTYATVSFDEEGDNTVLYLGDANTLYYPSKSMTIGAQRAFFQLNGLTAGEPTSTESGQQSIKAFKLNFGEETGIREISDYSEYSDYSETWFSLDGRHLGSYPATPSLYIHNGRKVLIK